MRVEICVLCGRQFSNQCRRHLLLAIQLAVSCSNLYFARHCALNRTGLFATESKVMLYIYFTDLRSDVLMFHS